MGDVAGVTGRDCPRSSDAGDIATSQAGSAVDGIIDMIVFELDTEGERTLMSLGVARLGMADLL